jgi:hypothetical protein
VCCKPLQNVVARNRAPAVNFVTIYPNSQQHSAPRRKLLEQLILGHATAPRLIAGFPPWRPGFRSRVRPGGISFLLVLQLPLPILVPLPAPRALIILSSTLSSLDIGSVVKFPFCGPQSSLTCSQEPATNSYPEPAEFSTNAHTELITMNNSLHTKSYDIRIQNFSTANTKAVRCG